MLSPYQDKIDIIRLVLLVEIEPLSNRYEQIALTEQQYLKVLDLLESFYGENDDINLQTNDGIIVLPEVKQYEDATEG